MSNLFDGFDFGEPSDLYVSHFESADQRYLRERYDSLRDRNALEVVMFNPEEINSFKKIRLHTGEREIEAVESKLKQMLMQDMLRSLQLDIPINENDPRFLLERNFADGSRAVIYVITRSDESLVPVYYQSKDDGVTPKILSLISFDRVEEAVLLFRDLDEYRTKVIEKTDIAESELTGLRVEELKWLDSFLDDLQKL